MPWEKGNKWGKIGGGRPGYAYEKKQMETMRKLLDRFLRLSELIDQEKATKGQKDAYDRLKPVLMKIMDKVHATKQDTHVEHDPIKIQISRNYD